MTLPTATARARAILDTKGTIEAIRFLRSLGISFLTARQMVRDIRADAPWYRRDK